MPWCVAVGCSNNAFSKTVKIESVFIAFPKMITWRRDGWQMSREKTTKIQDLCFKKIYLFMSINILLKVERKVYNGEFRCILLRLHAIIHYLKTYDGF